MLSLRFRLARSLSLSVGAWLPSAAPDYARALDWAAADFCLANSVGGGGRAMGSASPPAGLQHAVRVNSPCASLSDFRLARSLSLSVGAWLPSAAPDYARALDWAAADFIFGNSVGGGELWGQRRRRRVGNTAVRVQAAFHLCATFPRAREGGPSASGVSIRRRRRAAMGTVRREPIETPLAEGSVAGVRSGISGDRALDPWACGRRTARGQSWSPGAGRCRGPPPFSVWDLEIAVAELFGNSRSQQLAGGKPSDVLARCWIFWESAERDRSLNLLGKGAALHFGVAFPRAREGSASVSGFEPAAPARS